ncbi:MAG: class I SAM-dependent methyltransferase [Phycisphaerales bacterium]|nr:class I SAM-dependent methyltransferase [Phycisphaerales bacterium]
MVGDLESWTRLLDVPELVAEATARHGEDPLRVVSGLRRRWDAGLVACAVELAEARRRALAKMSAEVAAGLMADVVGVQMASSEDIASWKASRIREAGPGRVIDLCCGIGGDTRALAALECECVAVDLDPVRAWMAGHNASCAAIVDDATAWDVDGAIVHVDPSRRDEGTKKRHFDLASCTPGPDDLARFAAQADGCCFKLAPSVEPLFGGELEIVSQGGRVRQGLVWTGTLRTCERRATTIGSGGVHTFTGDPLEVGDIADRVESMLLEPDPALERACLLDAFASARGLSMLATSRLTTVASLPPAFEMGGPARGWVTVFEVLDVVPWKRIEEAIASFDGGEVEVKPRVRRSRGMDPDRLQVTLRGHGSTRLTVFIVEDGGVVEGIVARRIRPEEGDGRGPGTGE